MSATVHWGATEWSFPSADQYNIDGSGYLHLTTTYGNQVATFKPDVWSRVVITPSRGANGRFVKRS